MASETTLPALVTKQAAVDIQSSSTAALWREFSNTLEMTAATLTRLALIARELQRRGEDLSGIRSGLGAYLLQIASGKASADAVVQFAGQRQILNAVLLLPQERQRALALGEPVEVVTINGKGVFETISMRAHELTIAQVRLVFADGKIRPPEDQEAMIRTMRRQVEKQRRQRRAARALRHSAPVLVDHDEIVELAASLPDLTFGSDISQVLLRLTAAEHASLKEIAELKNMSMQMLVRATLAAADLI